jgi:hypothetical protein
MVKEFPRLPTQDAELILSLFVMTVTICKFCLFSRKYAEQVVL